MHAFIFHSFISRGYFFNFKKLFCSFIVFILAYHIPFGELYTPLTPAFTFYFFPLFMLETFLLLFWKVLFCMYLAILDFLPFCFLSHSLLAYFFYCCDYFCMFYFLCLLQPVARHVFSIFVSFFSVWRPIFHIFHNLGWFVVSVVQGCLLITIFTQA